MIPYCRGGENAVSLKEKEGYGQILHNHAQTTEAMRWVIQESLAPLPRRRSILSTQTIHKWKGRDYVYDFPDRSEGLTPYELIANSAKFPLPLINKFALGGREK
jgi:hypothetical protein